MGRVSYMRDKSLKGLPTYSELGFGESLSKFARHQLALVCLEAIRDELDQNLLMSKRRGRGRPTSPMGILSIEMNVHIDSVKRWTNLKEIQANDYNAERLAKRAFKYNPQEVVRILQADIARRREIMDKWLKEAESNYGVSPYVKNTEGKEGA